MADLYQILKPESKYYDRKNFDSQQQYNQALKVSRTVYVGNLSFYTTQDSLREIFSRAGSVNEIIMGINDEGNPCGFCFVIFESHEDAGYAVEYISKTKLNDRIIRVDWDPGFVKGREKGRGKEGQQRRDDFRNRDDAQRPKKRVHANWEREGNRDRGDRRYEQGDRGDQRHYGHGRERDFDRDSRGGRGRYDRNQRGYRDRQYNRGDQRQERRERKGKAEEVDQY